MTETFVRVPVDGTGKQIAAYLDSNGFYRQVVVWGSTDASGEIVATVKAPSSAPVTSTDGAGVVVTRPDSTINDGGTPINGATIPTGGIGLTGWASASWQTQQSILTKLNASIAVTGTFFQATQPVSGTFWQTTQPVSISQTLTISGGNKPVGPANIATIQSTINTGAAQQIVAARTGGVGTGRCTANLKNVGSVVIYVGVSGVTTSNGYPLSPGDSASFDTTASIFGAAGSNGGVIAVLETF